MLGLGWLGATWLGVSAAKRKLLAAKLGDPGELLPPRSPQDAHEAVKSNRLSTSIFAALAAALGDIAGLAPWKGTVRKIQIEFLHGGQARAARFRNSVANATKQWV